MKTNTQTILLITLFVFLTNTYWSQTIILNELKAFPTAEGAGASATGGRGGSVVWVTNANASGSGSFQDATTAPGPKTILFRDGGSRILDYEVYTTTGDMTIAGQSANELGGVYFDCQGSNSDVIYLTGGNMIARYIGTRGMRGLNGSNGDPVFQLLGSNCIIDHVTDIGGVQGNDVGNGIANTVQYCLYTEANHWHNVGVQYWANGYDGDTGFFDFIYNASILKSHRLPNIGAKANVQARIVNNYAYGWNSRHGVLQGEPQGDFINNLYQEAIDDDHTINELFSRNIELAGVHYGQTSNFYLKDNWHWKNDESDLFPVNNGTDYIHSSGTDDIIPIPENRASPLTSVLPYLDITDPATVKNYVLENAGAGVRYSQNSISTVTELESRYKNFAMNYNEDDMSIEDRTSFSDIPLQTRTLSAFELAHGFSEDWAIAHGLGTGSNVHNELTLNWQNLNDLYTVINNAGYTNLEIYLAELAGDFHMLFNQSPGDIQFALKTYLQGPYNPSNQMMNDNLRQAGALPLIEPFSALGFDHVNGGGETTFSSVFDVSGNDAIVDWIFVELRSAATPTTIIATQSALLQRDGDIVSTDGTSPVSFSGLDASNIIVALRHRSHLGMRTSSSYPTAGLVTIDFSAPSTVLYDPLPQDSAHPMATLGGVRMMLSGDANSDGQINLVDQNSYWRIQNSLPFSYETSLSDFDLNGSINAIDINLFWRPNNSKVEILD